MERLREKLRIVPMEERHLDVLVELERECFSEPWTRAGLAAEFDNPVAVFRVAELGGRPAGYAGMHCVLDECYVANVAVFPQYRRRGVARALMENLIAFAREYGERFLTLEVRPSNAAGLALYAGLGFREAGRRKDFYRLPKEDALLLTLTLGKPEGREPLH